jgi:hypothetical protein
MEVTVIKPLKIGFQRSRLPKQAIIRRGDAFGENCR